MMPEAPLLPSSVAAPLDSPRTVSGATVFGRRVLLFFAPLLLIIGVIECFLWQTGETWPVARVIAMQQTRPQSLFMRGILDQGFYRYKFLQLQEKKPKVVILGSSRVMEFRREMFGVRSNEVFNAGGMIQDLNDLDAYVQTLDGANAPEVMILGVDLWWFNGNKPLIDGFRSGIRTDAASDWQEHVRAWRRFKSSKSRKAVVAARRAANEHMGIEARGALVGFRPDGSMQYNFPLPAKESDWGFVDRENPPIAERIRKNGAQFTVSNGVARERIELLERSLRKLRENKVLVLGFLPPFSEEAATLLRSSAAHSNLWHEVRSTVPKVFSDAGLPFVDASLTRDLGLSDSYLIDGIHAAETFQVHLLARFLKEPSVQAVFPPLKDLVTSALASSFTNPWHPDYSRFFGE